MQAVRGNLAGKKRSGGNQDGNSPYFKDNSSHTLLCLQDRKSMEISPAGHRKKPDRGFNTSLLYLNKENTFLAIYTQTRPAETFFLPQIIQ